MLSIALNIVQIVLNILLNNPPKMVHRSTTMEDPKTKRPRSGVDVSDIRNALCEPIKVNHIKEDKQGNKSKKYVGKRATVSVNPDSGILIQCNPTSEKIARSIQDGKI